MSAMKDMTIRREIEYLVWVELAEPGRLTSLFDGKWLNTHLKLFLKHVPSSVARLANPQFVAIC